MIDSFISILKEFWVGIVVICIAIIIMIAVFITAVENNKEWEAFKIKHNCKLIERMSGSTSTGYGYGITTSGKVGYGMITTSTPSKECWICDDSVKYWR